MSDTILVATEDARRIADLLGELDDPEAALYANFLVEHADKHSFDDRWSEIGPLDEFIERHA